MQESRMYFFVMGNISGRQQGIQAGHAAVEYGLKYGIQRDYKNFAKYHKTFIVLDGGSSGDMECRAHELETFGVKIACFHEPDLNDSLSAIAFIVKEEIYTATDDDYAEGRISANQINFSRYLKSFKLASN